MKPDQAALPAADLHEAEVQGAPAPVQALKGCLVAAALVERAHRAERHGAEALHELKVLLQHIPWHHAQWQHCLQRSQMTGHQIMSGWNWPWHLLLWS